MYSFFLPLMSSFCFYIYKIPCFKRVFIFSFLAHFIGAPIFFLFMLIPHCYSLLFLITCLLSNFTISFVLKLCTSSFIPNFIDISYFQFSFSVLSFYRKWLLIPLGFIFFFFSLLLFICVLLLLPFFSFFISVLCCIHIISI
jgi:hypothetical protein